MSHSVFENGATWLRTDFHLHTRSDKEFNGVAPLERTVNLSGYAAAGNLIVNS
jgi:hypothetical protein